MKEIKYELHTNEILILSPECEFKINETTIRVGSVACQECNEFISVDKAKRVVICKKEIGREEGADCNRMACKGTIELHPPDNCSCHISPPCSACTDPRLFCATCGWEEMDE